MADDDFMAQARRLWCHPKLNLHHATVESVARLLRAEHIRALDWARGVAMIGGDVAAHCTARIAELKNQPTERKP